MHHAIIQPLRYEGDGMGKLAKKQYLVIRLALWVIAVFIALIPVIKSIDCISDLLQGDSFRDLLFVVVPVSALALSTTIDYLCVGFPNLTATQFFNCVCSTILNVIGLVTGLSGFLSIHDGPMTKLALVTYSALIAVSVISSLVTEVVVSLHHHSFSVGAAGTANAAKSPIAAPLLEPLPVATQPTRL
jgi:hypothetical protein